MAPLRWGVLGAGIIAHDYVTAMQIFPERHTVVVVGDGNLENAQKFAKDHNIPKAVKGDEAVVTDPDVDIVYIAYINTLHYAATKLALEHGKPVLCEKPFALNEKQTVELIQLAKTKKLFLMEAIWSRCFPIYKKIREIIDSGSIGDVMFLNANMGYSLQTKERIINKNLGGGALMDMGVYGLQFQQFVFRGLRPTKVVVNGTLTKTEVDGTSGVLITYPNGQLACIACSAEAELGNEAIIAGTKGILRIPHFWSPDTLITDEKTYTFELPQSEVPFVYENGSGMSYEADEVKRCLEEGKLECPLITLDETLELVKLRDMMRKSIGVKFNEDDF
ncbi:hypothetical protein WA026_013093 [Henosepilachna vigintioctopunctata]|uniref:Trans-1,2-dihydrobenzene-1,2-diol dehydrogenase n=1 Tax=Henosepilachna vigintioctopunctata TaxID=420089 RepID=A0AAW1UL08_9CUCU